MKKILYSILLFTVILSSCKNQPETEVRDDLKKYYDSLNVTGCLVILDEKAGKEIICNREMSEKTFVPASTFKICNSLIGLETGVIPDENFVLKWDSVDRKNPAWNKDQDLKEAFRNSTVWYYQELARRVGGEKMKYWLDKAGYGNADTSGGIDQFWLRGGLRISPVAQVDFVKKLHDNKLPFSQRSMDIVKKIMIRKDTAGIVLRGKTGWGVDGNTDIGWFTGYLETKDNVWYFANLITNTDTNNNSFAEARINIVLKAFEDMGVIPSRNLLSTSEDKRGYIVEPGQMAPDFTVNLTNGQSFTLSANRGKVVMLQFTASWCSVCRKEMPHIEDEIWQVNKNKDFVLVGLDRDEPMDVAKDFQKTMKITYPLAPDPGAGVFSLFADKNAGVTRNVIIDRSGKIVYLTRLYDANEFGKMKNVIQELLSSK